MRFAFYGQSIRIYKMDLPGYKFNSYLVDEDAPSVVTWRNLHKSTFGPKNKSSASDSDNDSHSSQEESKKLFQPSEHYDYAPVSGNPPHWKTRSYAFSTLGLHEEVLDFYQFMLPRPSEQAMRNEVVERVTRIIKNKWSDATVEVVGSFNYGLYLPTSDVDLVVFGKWPVPPLFVVEQEIRRANIFVPKSLLVIDKTSVPIIKFTDKCTEVKVDISFNIDSGLQSAHICKFYMNHYPVLDKLVIVIKQFLYQRNLNEVNTGGINSYCLLLLVVSFLQHHPRIRADSEDVNLGVLLTEFFELYGRNFNYQKVGIRVDNGGSYFSKAEYGMEESILCISNPLNARNNIGWACYGMWTIKHAFECAYVTLARALLGKEQYYSSNKTVLSLIISVSDEVMAYREWIDQRWGFVPPPINAHHGPLSAVGRKQSSSSGKGVNLKRNSS